MLLGLDIEYQASTIHYKIFFQFLGSCRPNCSCKNPNTWRSDSASLTDLEEVEIVGFQGKEDEVDFLELLFRCATANSAQQSDRESV
jgi:hypothetical protein